MESGCCLSCFNCCSFNCFNSIHLSVYQFITSLIGIALNSTIMTLSKEVYDSSKFLFSTQVINISFFSFGTTISTILLFFKKFEKLNQGWFYSFGWLSSKIYSINSKILMLVNIIGFFYLISFTQFLTVDLSEVGGQELFNNTLFNHTGPGKEIEYILKYKNKTLYCENKNCSSDEIYYEENDENNFGKILVTLFYSLLTCIIMFLNGESFSSDSQRIKFLSKGKLSLEFRPIDVVSSICTRKNSFNSLNFLFCYKATIFNIETLISTFSFLLFAFWVIFLYLKDNYLPIQAHFVSDWIISVPMVVSVFCFLLGMCCENCCCKNRTPQWKKWCAVIVLIFAIFCFPFEIISLPLSVGILNGKVKFRADCRDYVDYELDNYELYKSLCYEDYDNKYLSITLKSCSRKDIILIFVIVALGVFLIFNLIILLLGYIQRGIPEYGIPKRAYDVITYLIEENGEKVCVDDIKIEKEEDKTTENKEGKVVEFAKYVYKRIISPHQVPIHENSPIIYTNIN